MFNEETAEQAERMDERKKGDDLGLFLLEGLLAGQSVTRVFTCFSSFKLDLPVHSGCGLLWLFKLMRCAHIHSGKTLPIFFFLLLLGSYVQLLFLFPLTQATCWVYLLSGGVIHSFIQAETSNLGDFNCKCGA